MISGEHKPSDLSRIRARFARNYYAELSTLGSMAANPFTDHPHSVGESYREHMSVAFGVSRQLAGASVAALIHALVPRFHTTTASDRIRALAGCIERHDREGLRTKATLEVVDGAA